jgi:catechol 2,3-dioxygenase-like lactoylglutathione lyase family enzyme
MDYHAGMRLSRAMIYVKDLSRMAAFYADTIGLTPIAEARTRTWAEFDAGGAGFALHAIPAEIAEQIQISSPPQPREETPIKLSFAVPNLAAEVDRLRSLGVTIVERPWGAYDLVDPEGNIVGLIRG